MLRLEVAGVSIGLMKMRMCSTGSAQVLCQHHETRLLNVVHGRLRDNLYCLSERHRHQSLKFGCDMLNGGRGNLSEGALHDRVASKGREIGFCSDSEFHPGDLTEHN